MRSPPPEKNKRAMKNSALFAFLWLQSSLLAEVSHDEAKMRERRETSFLPRRERPLLAGKLQSSLNFRRLLRVILSPSVTEGVKNVSNIVEVRLAREMIGHMCHFYMRCQPSLCRLHTRLKRPLLPKHFFISQLAGSFHLKTKDREFKIKVRFGYNS